MVERFGLDLADRGARQELFDRLGATSTRAMALTEGVLSYLSVDEAGALADDLRAQPSFEVWVTEYCQRSGCGITRNTSRSIGSPSTSIQ